MCLIFFPPSGTVITICPLYEKDDPEYQQSYLSVSMYGSVYFTTWEMLVYVRNASTLTNLKKTPISELNPLQFQRVSFILFPFLFFLFVSFSLFSFLLP
jgi:hypothetical protein